MTPQKQIPAAQLSEAALDEMKFWLEIMLDHGRFFRNGLDPTEENLFHAADSYAKIFESLLSKVTHQNNLPPQRLNNLIIKVMHTENDFLDFNRNLEKMIRSCRALAILPADLLDHAQEEAIYFLSKLRRLSGADTLPRSELGIPDGSLLLSVPRLLIPRFTDILPGIFFEESLYWILDSVEHTGVLALYFRPRFQEQWVEQTLNYGTRLQDLYDRVLQASQNSGDFLPLIPAIQNTVGEWRNYLAQLFRIVSNCSIPTGQANFWPRLADHMRREADYYLEILNIIQHSAYTS